MDFQTEQPVDHVHAGALHRSRPFDVALLVEARLQLHQDRYLLVFLDGIEQRFHDRVNSGPRDKAHILIASTPDRCAAFRRNSTTGWKESNG